VWKGNRDAGTFSPGGRFSLGRMGEGSEYCIGMVVESRFEGVRWDGRDGMDWDRDEEESVGLDNVWIVGEGFFADVQVAFDVSSRFLLDFDACADRMCSGRRSLLAYRDCKLLFIR
jgi:hypothetical protein